MNVYIVALTEMNRSSRKAKQNTAAICQTLPLVAELRAEAGQSECRAYHSLISPQWLLHGRFPKQLSAFCTICGSTYALVYAYRRRMQIYVMQGHLDVMQLLRKFGAQVDVCNSSNWTPLHRAAYCGFPDACEWLLNNAASIHAVNK